MKSVLCFELIAVIFLATHQTSWAASSQCSPKVYPVFKKGSAEASKDLDWWQKSPIYQIYPRSFLDSNGDGVGDLKGIESKLDYFNDIGIEAIWICPFFKSPMKDFGYDISDYKAIDPLFGTMNDLDLLIKTAKKKGINVLLDLVPNHSSNEHEWFNKSRQREDPFTDYYVWKDGKGPDKKQPPNNWLSVFGGSTWTYDEVRGQFYLHQFLKQQPDLNFRNPAVRKEMENIIRFWLDKGADGFRVDAFHTMFEDENYPDEPLSHDPDALPTDYAYLNHTYTTNLPECFDLIAEWMKIFNSYEEKDNHSRVLLIEAVSPDLDVVIKFYGNSTQPLADFAFNFQLTNIVKNSTAVDAHKLITDWLDAITPSGKWSNWELAYHDKSRIATRIGQQLQDGMNMLMLTLPGTPVSYYGEEIGMEDIEVSWEETQDNFGKNAGKDRYKKFSRDPERSPMQWNQTKNGGFSSANKTWLPVNPNYERINAEMELKANRSHLQVYRDLVLLRRRPTFQKGSVQFPLITESLYTSLRMLNDSPGYLTVINWSKKQQKIDFTKACTSDFKFPKDGKVVIGSTNIPDDSSLLKGNRTVSLSNLTLDPYQSVIIEFNPVFSK